MAKVSCVGPNVTSCVVNSTVNNSMFITNSNWAVIGWNTSSTSASCFIIQPYGGSANIHHVAIINSIANGCLGGGFGSSPYSATAGVDQFAVIGSIAYNSTQGTSQCFSGISVYDPRNNDTSSGSHIFVAGNFSWANIDAVAQSGDAKVDPKVKDLEYS